MASPTKPTYGSLQAGRGIAAVVVLLYHAAYIMGTDAAYWRIPLLHQRTTGLALGVEFFFVLSGVVILLAHYDDVGHPQAVAGYLWKRFRRVYPIYWVVLTAVLASFLWRPELRASHLATLPVIASSYLLLHLGTLDVNLSVAWTLFHEILFYALFTLLLLRRKPGLIMLALWFSASGVMLFVHAPDLLREYLIAPVNLLFGFGMVVAWWLRNRVTPRAGVLTAIGASSLAVAVAAGCIRLDLGNPVKYLAGIGAALLMLGTARLEQQGRLRVPQRLRSLGDASYSIYLVHLPVLQLVAPVAYRMWLRHSIPLVTVFVLLSLTAIAAGCALHLLIERPLLRLLSQPQQ